MNTTAIDPAASVALRAAPPTPTEPEPAVTVERLATLTAEEVDDLPYGFLILDPDGTVLLYNRYESRMSRLPPERVIGRNWFRQIAPCTRVEAFHGRFRRLVADADRAVERFSFCFHFLHGAQDVSVQLAKSPAGDGQIFMTVVRRKIETPADRRPASPTLDPTSGALDGPLGPVLGLPLDALGPWLSRQGAAAARALGEAVGTRLAEAAAHAAAEAGEPALDAAPALLRSGTLDDALSRAGLGRVAVDLTARERSGALGLILRPPAGAGSPGLAAFYEGALTSALGAALGAPMTVRWLDAGEGASLPWFFVAVPSGAAALLEEAGRVPAATVLAALGLGGEPEE